MEHFQKLIQQTIVSNLSNPQTQQLLVDEYIVKYLVTVYSTADYANKDILSTIIKIVSPILYNLKLTSTKDEAAEVVSSIFQVVESNQPNHQTSQMNNPVSALQLLQKREMNEQKFKEMQASRDIYQQKLNYQMQKQHEKAEIQLAKRILKGKDSVFKEQLDKKQSEITTSDASKVLKGGIELHQLTLSYGSNILLENCTASFNFGHRYCLVARNGAGKSSLLRAISSNEIHCIANREQLKVLYVAQEVPSSDDLVIDVVLSADEDYVRLNKLQLILEAALDDFVITPQLTECVNQILEVKEITEEIVAQALDFVMQQQMEFGCFEKRAKAAKILSGLLFTSAMQVKPTKELSGGWKMRVALARALFTDPDILMLDEPTNNLDLLATLWLEDWLSNFNKKSMLIVVSHDISFINSFATDIVLLTDRNLFMYAGNYSSFAQARSNELLNKERQQDRTEMHRAHIEKFVNRFRYNAKRASLVQSRIKVLDKMVDIQLSREKLESFEFPQAWEDDYDHNHDEPLIELKNVGFSYVQNKLGGFKIADVSLCVYSDSRIALCGANAAGKSTILKILAGFLKASTGDVNRTKNAICAVFWQHHQDQIDLNSTPMDTLKQFCPGETEANYRSHLSRFGIGPTMINQVNRTLSGGQKTRLSLSLLTFNTNPKILILDELTNHIDIETKQALIEALQLFNGAVVVVSHDGPFVSAVTDQLYIVSEGKLTEFDGEFDDYKDQLKRQWRK